MKPELTNPFTKSLSNTFASLLGLDVQVGMTTGSWGKSAEISAIVGLSGKLVGTMVLGFSEQLAVKATESMLLLPTDGINDDVVDAVGDIATAVANAVKGELNHYEFFASLPCVVTGRLHRLRFPSNIAALALPCQTAWGPLLMEVGLAPIPQLAST